MPQIYDCRSTILKLVHKTGLLSTVFQWKGNHPIVNEQEIQKSQLILNELKSLILELEITLKEETQNQVVEFVLPEVNTKFNQLEFEDLRKQINDWCHQRDWEQYHTPKNIVMALIGEVGELSEIFIDGEFLPGLPELNQQQKHHTGEEIADILHNLIRLCDRCNIDIVTAIQMKIQKNSIKYPINKVKGSNLKYDEYQK
ncbi:unnamed protein product (macronuclear) [Paramecium tetraurelia]|uniref:NTP pyrophosphohydrolase MazG putative catalytic core domain-containing protein n=1 Tax=Paramecium tetraurelia TaxID=5888 RepID=A0C4V6_PARTE|nr:uncharacterized protein GSPATT00006322001 [Paramecium tetraurelia]CAK65823.1 unnamed protein product [Paramecium tetraurelia]|eukprot:XP_001433220.1 hypothetical protein (macronuclear) [Paramecium tetraurelia strain d4-2]